MAGRIPRGFVDELLARIDIVEVIEARVPLKRAGREYKACCPFHDERTPSFTVSPHKQFYHCFGCGAHGTAIGFLMEYDRLEFPDAVEELAGRAGLKVPYERGAPAPEDRSDDYAVLAAAAHWFEGQLRLSDRARAYLDRRGVDEALRQRFQLGYAPDAWDGLLKGLGGSPSRVRALASHGLLIAGDRGGHYDRFRDRVIFPIHDRRGRPIAFGGRILDAGEPKYLNSPETALFQKGRQLYGLWQARQAQGKLPRLLVVEGYMDVIALFQHGLPFAVATLGTATTREHAELLFRSAPDVVFCFDGDRAGRQAAWRAVESVLPRMRDGRQAFFLFLPEGEDPDSLVRAEGAAGLNQRLGEATPLSEFLLRTLAEDADLATVEGRARLAERARPLLDAVPDGAFRDLMREELRRRTGVRPRVPKPPPIRPPAGGRELQRTPLRTAIGLLLQNPRLIEALEPPYLFGALDLPGMPLLLELIDLCRRRPEANTAVLLQHFEGRAEQAALAKLAALDWPFERAQEKAEFVGAVIQLNRQFFAHRVEELSRKQVESGLSEAEKGELREALRARAGVAAD
jgi:DNA primase